MKKHIISVVALVAVFVMMFVGAECTQKTFKGRTFDEMDKEIPINDEGYEYYKNLYKFNDDYNGDGIVSEEESDEMYYRVMLVNSGLYKIGEKYLGDYGNCVYRYALVSTWGCETDYCIRVELNKNKTFGKAIIITNTNEYDKDFNGHYTVTQKYMNKKTVDEFLKLAESFDIENQEIYEEYYGDDGAFYGIEKYENGKYYYVTRWDLDVEYMDRVEAFFSMFDENMADWSLQVRGIIYE